MTEPAEPTESQREHFLPTPASSVTQTVVEAPLANLDAPSRPSTKHVQSGDDQELSDVESERRRPVSADLQEWEDVDDGSRASKRRRVEQSVGQRSSGATPEQPQDHYQSTGEPHVPDASTEQPELAAPNGQRSTRSKSIPGGIQSAKNARARTQKGRSKTKDRSKTAKSSGHRTSKPRKPRRRETTPEGAEDEVITPSMITMAELCTDSGKGKKSSRERELVRLEHERGTRRKSARRGDQSKGGRARKRSKVLNKVRSTLERVP